MILVPGKPTTQWSQRNDSESRGPVRNEGRADLGDTVGEGELELRDQELLDVGAADVLGLLDLDNTEDLRVVSVSSSCLRIFSSRGTY